MVRIVNVVGLKPNDPSVIYCGRPFAGWRASPLSNPFRLSDWTAREAIGKYRTRLRGQIEAGDRAVMEALASIREDSVLGCWCVNRIGADPDDAHKRCHCEVIIEEWEAMLSRDQRNSAARSRLPWGSIREPTPGSP